MSPLVILPLCERSDLIDTFTIAFEQEWPEWYGAGGRGDARGDLMAFAGAPDGPLPVGMVAVDTDGQALGIAALKAPSIPSHAHLGPWAAAGLVLPAHRGRGIGAVLLQALVRLAGRQGCDTVYCATATAAPLLRRQGWRLMETVVHEGHALEVFCAGVPHVSASPTAG